MKKIFVLVFLLLVVNYSCSDKNEKNNYENIIKGHKAELIKTGWFVIKEDSSSFIGRFYNQKFINGNLIISDIIQPALFFINSNGEIVKTLRWLKGEGPGEINKISDFEIINERVYITDVGNFRWSVFDTLGNFIKSAYPFKDPRKRTSNKHFYGQGNILKNGESLITCVIEARFNRELNQDKSNSMAVLDTSLNIIKVFGFMDDIYGKFRLYNSGSVITSDDAGSIYFSQKSSYKIYKYNKEGIFIKSFGIKGKFRETEEDIPGNLSYSEIQKRSKNCSGTMGLFYSSKGYILYYFTDLTDAFYDTRDPTKRINYLKIYDTQGNYLKSDLILPGCPLALNDNNELLILESEEPNNRKVGTYKLKIVDD